MKNKLTYLEKDLLKCYEPTDEEFGRLRDCLQKVEIVNRAINKR